MQIKQVNTSSCIELLRHFLNDISCGGSGCVCGTSFVDVMMPLVHSYFLLCYDQSLGNHRQS